VPRHPPEPPDPDEDVLIADSGAEQVLLGVVWRVLKTTGRWVNLLGPLAGRHAGAIFQVVSAAAKLIDENGTEYCAIVHEGLLDRDAAQKESLLASAQVCRAGNALDDCHREAFDPVETLVPNVAVSVIPWSLSNLMERSVSIA